MHVALYSVRQQITLPPSAFDHASGSR